MIKKHNTTRQICTYIWSQRNIIMAGAIIIGVLVFVDQASPNIWNNILHDLITRR